MITVPPSLLAHPADLQRLAGELLALRFDRARLTEALLRVQEAAHEVAAPGGLPSGADVLTKDERERRERIHSELERDRRRQRQRADR